jgi:hypothetical protein
MRTGYNSVKTPNDPSPFIGQQKLEFQGYFHTLNRSVFINAINERFG